MINSGVLEKLALTRHIIVYHSDFTKALTGIQQCMQKSEIFKESAGCLLLGKGGVGKSTICKILVKKYPAIFREEENCIRSIVPILYLSVPSPVTIKSLTIRMLEELGCLDHKGTSEQLNYRLRTLLKECDTKLIMLDEFHHIYNCKTKEASRDVGNWLKTLGDMSRVCLCLIGLPDFVDHLYLDSQLARRFSSNFLISPLSLKNSGNGGSLKPFLSQIENRLIEKLKIEFQPSISSDDFVNRIFLITQGYQHYVIALIRESCQIALSKNNLIIGFSHFQQAANTGITAYISLTKQHVFELSIPQIQEILRKKYL